jgi:hypothetical protein
MSRSKAPLAIGLAAAGGVGYYLYSAGGNPRAAEKQFESEHTPAPNTPPIPAFFAIAHSNSTGDAHHIAAKIKGETPHRSTDAEQQGRKVGQELGAKVDNAVCPSPLSILCRYSSSCFSGNSLTATTPQVETVNRDISKAKSETESYAKAAKADALKKVDEFDRKVEEGASKSKSYLSSWFGGK